VIQYGVHFDPPEGDESRRKPGVQSTGRGFRAVALVEALRAGCVVRTQSGGVRYPLTSDVSPDPPLEGGGFEPSVPLWRTAPGLLVTRSRSAKFSAT
jgi:hypothetical protein